MDGQTEQSRVNGHEFYHARNRPVLSTRIRILLKTEAFPSVYEKIRRSTRKRKNGGNLIAPGVEHAHCSVNEMFKRSQV